MPKSITMPPKPPTEKVIGKSRAKPMFTDKPGIAPIKIPTPVPATKRPKFYR